MYKKLLHSSKVLFVEFVIYRRLDIFYVALIIRNLLYVTNHILYVLKAFNKMCIDELKIIYLMFHLK